MTDINYINGIFNNTYPINKHLQVKMGFILQLICYIIIINYMTISNKINKQL